jgi:hypothetical protein
VSVRTSTRLRPMKRPGSGSGVFVVAALLWFIPGAASAGAGWYLLIPSAFRKDNTLAVDTDVPLGSWQHYAAFDSARACEVARAEMYEAADKALKPGGQVEKHAATLSKPRPTEQKMNVHDLLIHKRLAEMEGRCVASDDPRLK